MQTGSPIDIITGGFIYSFDEIILEQMSDIIRIIMQRITTDAKAAELFKTLFLEEGIVFVENGLKRAVELGRFAPFDTHTMSVFINSIRLYTLLCWLADAPEEEHAKVQSDEQAMYACLAGLLPGTAHAKC